MIMNVILEKILTGLSSSDIVHLFKKTLIIGIQVNNTCKLELSHNIVEGNSNASHKINWK